MADRTSATLFGTIFQLLAENPSVENSNIAKRIWPMTSDYDFSNYQMYADDALIALGLARYGKEDGNDVIIYANYDLSFDE